MMLNHWKIKASLKLIEQKLDVKEGEEFTLVNLVETIETYGLKAHVLKGGMESLTGFVKFPLLTIFPNHLSILYKIKKDKVFLADSFYGFMHMHNYYFANNWFADKSKEYGIFLLVLPTTLPEKTLQKVAGLLETTEKLEKRYWKNFKLH